MRKLNKNELININGGFKISGAILQYGRLFVLAFYDIGVGILYLFFLFCWIFTNIMI